MIVFGALDDGVPVGVEVAPVGVAYDDLRRTIPRMICEKGIPSNRVMFAAELHSELCFTHCSFFFPPLVHPPVDFPQERYEKILLHASARLLRNPS